MWCSSLAKGKFVSGDWNFKVRKDKEKKSRNAERKGTQGKRISGKKMEKEDLLLWKRLFVALGSAEGNLKLLKSF